MITLPPPDSFACFCERVRCLSILFTASTTSGGRTELRNAKVGGHKDSKHQLEYGSMAVDLVPNDILSKDTRRLCVITAKKFGMWAKDEGDHVHVQGLPPGTGKLP